MSRHLLRPVCLVAGGLWLACLGTAAAQSDSEIRAAAGNFRNNCMHCHQPPDKRFATDLAWLDQVKRTS